jgi:hypothetical protein
MFIELHNMVDPWYLWIYGSNETVFEKKSANAQDAQSSGVLEMLDSFFP